MEKQQHRSCIPRDPDLFQFRTGEDCACLSVNPLGRILKLGALKDGHSCPWRRDGSAAEGREASGKGVRTRSVADDATCVAATRNRSWGVCPVDLHQPRLAAQH